ncbi:hypothetical protein BJV78DRAFT_1256522 [Lactifluus subvellereus]|nr:hypothetical protein BJV78DRAFT_1256522 [Lactifluus subvellereus]
MLLSICGTPMRTFNRMGMSSKKLGGHPSDRSTDKRTVIIHQATYDASSNRRTELANQGRGV